MQLAVARHHQRVNIPLPSWTPVRAALAVSAALLAAGFLLPDRFAEPLVALGVAGVLAARLSTMSRGWSPRGAASALAMANAAGRRFPTTSAVGVGEARTHRGAASAWSAALVDDALDDSFPASDPPSWTALRSGPPGTNAPVAPVGT